MHFFQFVMQVVSFLIVIVGLVRTTKINGWRQRWHREIDRLSSHSELPGLAPTASKEMQQTALDRSTWLLAQSKYPAEYPIWRAFVISSCLAVSSAAVIPVIEFGQLSPWLVMLAPAILATASAVFLRSVLLGEVDTTRWKLVQMKAGAEIGEVRLPQTSWVRWLRASARPARLSRPPRSALGAIIWYALRIENPDRHWSQTPPSLVDDEWMRIGRTIPADLINAALQHDGWHHHMR